MMGLTDKYPIEKRTKWSFPEGGGAPLLTMPNIPKPLHGVNPRLIMGDAAWNRARKRAYFDAGYKSEISGKLCLEPGGLHAHEVYSINYVTGTCRFRKICAITPEEHVYFIHSGRMLTLWKNKNPLYTTSKVLAGVENGFRLIYEWNKAHKKSPRLKVYKTFLEYLKQDELRDAMEELIKQYRIEFWGEDTKKECSWGDWKLLIPDKESGKISIYPTPYASYSEWEQAMLKRSENDVIRKADNPFKGGPYDEMEKILKEVENEERKGI